MFRLTALAAGIAFAVSGAQAQSQVRSPAPDTLDRPVPLEQADIAVVLTARADKVRFHGPPQASIRLYAEPGGSIEAKYEPGLLPRVIRPTVTYSNVQVSYIGGVLLAASPDAADADRPPATSP